MSQNRNVFDTQTDSQQLQNNKRRRDDRLDDAAALKKAKVEQDTDKVGAADISTGTNAQKEGTTNVYNITSTYNVYQNLAQMSQNPPSNVNTNYQNNQGFSYSSYLGNSKQSFFKFKGT